MQKVVLKFKTAKQALKNQKALNSSKNLPYPATADTETASVRSTAFHHQSDVCTYAL
jgi:hypothetical protein